MSRFTHPTFKARVITKKDEYKRTVCIVCQRWSCNPKVPNPATGVIDEPKCYKKWLGDRADTPEAQAAFRAAPYQGEGALTVGWRRSSNAKCGRCGNAAMKPESQATLEKSRDKDATKLRMRTMRAGRKAAKAAASSGPVREHGGDTSD